MSRRWILLMLVLAPTVLGVTTFAVIHHAGSQGDGGVIHAPPHPAPAAAPGSAAPPVQTEASGSGSSSPPAASPAAPSNSSGQTENAAPAQNDSAEVYGPARFAAASETADESESATGEIHLAMATGITGVHRWAGATRRGGGGGGAGGGGGSESGSAAHNNDGPSDEGSPPPDESTPNGIAPDEGTAAPEDLGPPPSNDIPGPSSPPLVTVPDPDLYNPLPPGDGDPHPPTHQAPPVGVPEPATMGMLALGLFGCAFGRRRR